LDVRATGEKQMDSAEGMMLPGMNMPENMNTFARKYEHFCPLLTSVDCLIYFGNHVEHHTKRHHMPVVTVV